MTVEQEVELEERRDAFLKAVGNSEIRHVRIAGDHRVEVAWNSSARAKLGEGWERRVGFGKTYHEALEVAFRGVEWFR